LKIRWLLRCLEESDGVTITRKQRSRRRAWRL